LAPAATTATAATGAASPFEARLLRRLATQARHRAPAVLERLVAEELSDPQAARARRFAGDLERTGAPGALARRLSRSVDAGRSEPLRVVRRRWIPASAVAAAAVLALTLFVLRDRPERGRPFTVHYGRPAAPSPLAASLVDGWTGGFLAAGGRAAWEEQR
jgi:hypothetical protein